MLHLLYEHALHLSQSPTRLSYYGDTKSITNIGDAVVHLMTYETIFGLRFGDLTGTCFRSGPALELL